MTRPRVTAGDPTPPLKSLIFKDSGFALSKIYQCSVFRSIEGASRGTPGGGSPTLRAAPPPPPKAPQRGGDPTPRGAGACRPPVRPSAAPSTPLGHPYGVPPASPAPPPVRSGSEGGKRSAQGVSPERGWKKIKVVAPIAAARPPAVEMWGRRGSRWAGVGAAGGQPSGLSTGCPCSCPRTGVAARRSRSDLHISTAGGPTRPPLGACFAPQGSRLPFRKSSEYTCLSSGPPEARF